MGQPFLRKQDPERFDCKARNERIYENTLIYLEVTNTNEPVIVEGKAVTEWPMPPAYYWLKYIDRWGLPNEGTWLDQPADWMDELTAADRARREWQMIEEINRRRRAQNRD